MAVPIKRALVSVFDKTGLAELAQAFEKLNISVLSTGAIRLFVRAKEDCVGSCVFLRHLKPPAGGTATALRTLGLAVVEVSDVTKVPEMLGMSCERGVASACCLDEPGSHAASTTRKHPQ
jgi:AICAR transformylase/IMP cyclohydrolase PurH